MSLSRISYDLTNDSFDVNHLHSYIAVYSQSTSTVEITDSQFIGGYSAVDMIGGTLTVSNSTFESMTVSILANFADSVQISECSFTFVGELHGPMIGLGDYGAVGIIDISDSANGSLSDSVCSTYTPGGFVVWNEVRNVMMNGNEFEIDPDGHLTNLYGVDWRNYTFLWKWAAVAFESCGAAQITENVFTTNYVQSSTPWIYINTGSGTTCLSGNKLSYCVVHVSKIKKM